MSVARAGGRADTGADAAGVHASNGWEVGVMEDGELERQPALDAAGKTGRVSEGWLLSRKLFALIFGEKNLRVGVCVPLSPRSVGSTVYALLQTRRRHLTEAHGYLLLEIARKSTGKITSCYLPNPPLRLTD